MFRPVQPYTVRQHMKYFMSPGFRCARAAGVALLFALAAFGQQSRISRRIDSTQRFVLHGQIHPRATAANDIGRVSASLEIPYVSLQFAMTDAQKADLRTLLAAQQDPKSPLYHEWLTPAQYADRFGVSQADVNQITDWLKNQGLTIAGVAQGRDWVAVKGEASLIEKAFATQLH